MLKTRLFFQILFASILMCILFMSVSLPASAASRTSAHQGQALIGTVSCSNGNKVRLDFNAGDSLCYTGAGEIKVNRLAYYVTADNWSGFLLYTTSDGNNHSLGFCNSQSQWIGHPYDDTFVTFLVLSPTRESWC